MAKPTLKEMAESFVLTYDHEQLIAENERLRAVIEEAAEAAEILDNLMDSVRKHGNYSQDATLLFLSHARQCLNCLTPNDHAHRGGAA